jgi:hypothetical protein
MWYNKNAIANILALSNVTKQYRVTYDSDDKMFVVHSESVGKPNMESFGYTKVESTITIRAMTNHTLTTRRSQECILPKSQECILPKSQECILSSSQEWMGMKSMPQTALRFRISTTPHKRLSQ